MSFLAISGLVNFVTCFVLGLFVFLKNIRNIRNISYFILNSSVAFYSLGYLLWQLSKNELIALFWFKVLVTGIILINISYLFFVFVFLEMIEKRKKFLLICFFINIIFIILNLSGLLYRELIPKYNLGLWPRPTFFFHLYLIFWFWQCLYGFYWLVRGVGLFTGVKREQIRYFLVSAIIGFLGGAANWPMWYGIYFPPYPNILISVYVGIVAYAIVKHHLLDIKIAVTRAGIFVALYALILGMPFWLGYKLLGKGIWFSILFFGMVLASLGPFVYNYFRGKAENILLKEQKRYQKALKDFASTIIFIKDIEELAQKVVSKIMASIEVRFCAIYLKETDKEFKGRT